MALHHLCMSRLCRIQCFSYLLYKRIAPEAHWLCKQSPFHSQLSPSGQTSLEWRIPPPKQKTHIFTAYIDLLGVHLTLEAILRKYSMTCSVLTFRWRLVGCMYWPSVKQSTPASRSSETSPGQHSQEVVFTLHQIFGSISTCDLQAYTPVRVLSICWSVSPSPSMMDVLVSTVGLTFLACFRTLRDWSKFALGSRTCLETDGADGQ